MGGWGEGGWRGSQTLARADPGATRRPPTTGAGRGKCCVQAGVKLNKTSPAGPQFVLPITDSPGDRTTAVGRGMWGGGGWGVEGGGACGSGGGGGGGGVSIITRSVSAVSTEEVKKQKNTEEEEL